jgi:hypothetical protein
MSKRILVFAGLLLLSACGRRSPDEAVASYYQSRINGDLEGLVSHLTTADSEQLQRYGATDTLNLDEDLGFLPAGEPGVQFDSTEVLIERGDTAFVHAFLTVPNWERVGGRFETVDFRQIDKGAANPDIVATLPKVRRTEDTRWVWENGSWKLSSDLGTTARVRSALMRYENEEAPLETRRGAAEEFVRISPGTRWDPYVRADAESFLAGLPVVDSLKFTIDDYLIAFHGVRVTNATRRTIERLKLQIEDAEGRTHEADFSKIPANGKGYTVVQSKIAFPVRAMRVSNIRLKIP